ncbi:hypothetical protein BDR05DRAFT_956801 [Suillus weaverae]|nr:hypothetical protein BDR05DRAFT_956801 [Suillus weaverae]
MHQALLIPEVLLEIFEHVFTDRETPLASLVVLATTCKAFYEPAMDLLWGEIPQLIHLLGCVTRLHPLVYGSGPTYRSAWTRYIEPLSAREARQFLRHSARIRSLKVSSPCFVNILSDIPIETCVFPRLMSLTWNLSTVKYLDLFLPHTLRKCYIQSVNELQPVVTRCAALELLSILTSDAGTVNEVSLLSDGVRLCKQLVTLSCPLLNWEAWKHLSKLPTLTRVEVFERRSDGARPRPLEEDIVNFSPFFKVSALSFRLYNAAYSIAILYHSQFPSLKEFEINLRVLSSAEAEQLLRALSHSKACQTLQKIVITLDNTYQVPLGNPLTVIPHLLCFTQLRDLRLICKNHFIDLDNGLLLEGMSSWPHIRTLEINDSGLHPSVTFRGLFAAFRLCPHLHTLKVPVDIVNIDIDPNAAPIQHISLRTLDLDTAGSPIRNAEALACIIFTWLPCVHEVSPPEDYWEDIWDWNEVDCIWNEVNEHLAILHSTGATSDTSP